MCMLDTVRAKRDEIYALARKHKAEKLWVFGSVARMEETPQSDVDFLVKFLPSVSYRDADALEGDLSTMLGRDVDVVRNTAVLNDPYFASRVCPEAVAI